MTFSSFEGALGGIGLFLLGMRLMSEGIRSVADERVRQFVVRMVSNRFFSLLFGIVMTFAVSSGSAGIIFTIGLLNGGVLTPYQSICVFAGVLLGSALSLHLHIIPYSLLSGPLILAGFIGKYYFRSRRLVHCATLLLGIGLLFLGLSLLEGSYQARDHNLLYDLGHGLLNRSAATATFFGAVVAFLVQSAQSTISIISGLEPEAATVSVFAFSMSCGSLVGMAAMGLLSAVGGNTTTRRIAIFFAGVALLVNVPLILFAAEGTELSRMFAAFMGRSDRHSILSFSYTLPCLLASLILLITAGWVSRANKTIESSSSGGIGAMPAAAGYLDHRILSTPSIALEQARKEIYHMVGVVTCMFADVRSILSDFDARRAETIRQRENLLDTLNSEITSFLAALSNSAQRLECMFEIPALIQVVSGLEHIGDASEDILNCTLSRKESGILFSDEAMEDILSLAEHVGSLLSQAENVVVSGVPFSPDELHASKHRARGRFDQIKQSHFERISAGVCPPRSAMLFQEILSSLIRISEICWSIMAIRTRNSA